MVSPHLLLDPLPLPTLSPPCLLSLPLKTSEKKKQTGVNTNEQVSKQKYEKRTWVMYMCAHGWAHTHTHPIKVKSWPSAAGHGTCPFTQWNSLRNINFSFASCCLLEIASWLVQGALMPTSHLNTGALHSLNLCRPRTCCLSQSLCSHVCTHPAESGRHHFLGIIHLLWLLQDFCLLFRIILLDRFNEDNSFKSESSRGSHSLHIVWLWASVSIPIYCSWNLLWR